MLDSIYNDYPIGSVLLWETNEELPSSRNIGGFQLPNTRAEYPLNYVLDGQQRVTSIFAVFCRDLPQDGTAFDADLDMFDIFFDIDTKKFVHQSKLDASHTNLEMRLLFDNFEFNVTISQYDKPKAMLAVKLQSLFQNYELPTVTIKKREKTEVGTIFERINNTGTDLSTLDLMIAWTWREDYHLQERFDEIFEMLELKSFGNIKQKVILQCFGAVIEKTTVTSKILQLDPDAVRDNSQVVKDSLEKVIDYISTQFNVLSDDFLPKAQQIVPLCYLFSKSNRLSIEQKNAVSKWFWRTTFSSRYSSATDEAMDADIAFFDNVLINDFSDTYKYVSTVNSLTIKKQVLTKANPNVRAILLLFAQFKPLDLTNGTNIDLGTALSSYNKKEYHHVFPKAYLKTRSYTNDQLNVIANFCFLPASSNKVISDKEPSDYFFNVIPQGKDFNVILESNLLPMDVNIYMNNDYDKFIDERLKKIDDAIKGLTQE